MSKIIVRNEDCRKTIKHMINKVIKVDCVLTSPPYNTSRKVNTEKEINERKSKYKNFNDSMPNDEYRKFIKNIISDCDKILKKNGVILLNLNYASSVEIDCRCSDMIILLYNIISETIFDIADIIVWKKKSALPNNRSKNKLTRITEYVFVICRKDEYMSFKSNKKITSYIEDKNLRYYENVFNYIEAKNNDGKNPYNNATFSTEFVKKLLQMYVKDNSIVYDCFGGTGTTAIGCLKENRNISCILSEIDKEQCEYAKERIKEIKKSLTNNKK